MLRLWFWGVLLSALLWVLPADAQSKPADYLKNGRLKERVEVTIMQGGFAGQTGEYYAVNLDGSWATGSVRLPKEGKSKPKGTGKLTAKQLARLAQTFARYDLFHLPNFGEPVVNPRTVTVQFGVKTVTMTEKRPTPKNPLSAHDKAITFRYQGIQQAVQGLCKPSAQNMQSPQAVRRKRIEAQIVKIVAQMLDLQPSEVKINTPLSKQKKPADELDLVEIVMSIEEAFDIEIKDTEINLVLDNKSPSPSIAKLTEIVARKTKK